VIGAGRWAVVGDIDGDTAGPYALGLFSGCPGTGVLYGAATPRSLASSSSAIATRRTRVAPVETAGPEVGTAAALARSVPAVVERGGVARVGSTGPCLPVSSVGVRCSDAAKIPATTSTAAPTTNIPDGVFSIRGGYGGAGISGSGTWLNEPLVANATWPAAGKLLTAGMAVVGATGFGVLATGSDVATPALGSVSLAFNSCALVLDSRPGSAPLRTALAATCQEGAAVAPVSSAIRAGTAAASTAAIGTEGLTDPPPASGFDTAAA
jgi:hypothetical protein